MRKVIIGLLIGIAGVISIAMTARYGWKQADNDVDQVFSAVMYGSIALFAICFDGLAVYFWFKHLRKVAIFVGAIACAAFVVTFTNSLGSIASRSDAVEAQRVNVKDVHAADSRELIRLETALANLGKYDATDAEAVAASRRAADTASENRRLECDKRGPHCRDRETDDANAASALATVTASKAKTDRGRDLEAQIAKVRAALGKSNTVGHTNPLGNVLSLLMGSTSDALTAHLQAIIALVFELCIVGLMVAFEALGHTSPSGLIPVRAALVAETVVRPARGSNILTMAPHRKALAAPTNDTEDDEIDPTPVIRFLKERVPKVEGAEADWGDIFRALPAWWADQKGLGGEPPTPAQLGAILRFISEETGIPTRKRGGKVYFIDRKVV
jgi:hypothetical protein